PRCVEEWRAENVWITGLGGGSVDGLEPGRGQTGDEPTSVGATAARRAFRCAVRGTRGRGGDRRSWMRVATSGPVGERIADFGTEGVRRSGRMHGKEIRTALRSPAQMTLLRSDGNILRRRQSTAPQNCRNVHSMRIVEPCRRMLSATPEPASGKRSQA